MNKSDGQTKKKFVIKTEKSPDIINTVIIRCDRKAKHLNRNALESNYKIAIYYARGRVIIKEKNVDRSSWYYRGNGNGDHFNEPEGELLLIFPE